MQAADTRIDMNETAGDSDTPDRLECMKQDWKLAAVMVVGAALVYGMLVWLVPGGFVG